MRILVMRWLGGQTRPARKSCVVLWCSSLETRCLSCINLNECMDIKSASIMDDCEIEIDEEHFHQILMSVSMLMLVQMFFNLRGMFT